jgi:hypothetical protein
VDSTGLKMKVKEVGVSAADGVVAVAGIVAYATEAAPVDDGRVDEDVDQPIRLMDSNSGENSARPD